MTQHLLPRLETFADYRPLRRQADPWLGAMRAICQRHGLDPARLQQFGTGTNVVFHTGGAVIKLVLSLWRDDARRERVVLEHLDGRLHSPLLQATGELEGWPYLVMSRLPGRRIGDVWSGLSQTDRRALTDDLAALIGELHALPTAPVAELLPPGGDWPTFLASQRARFRSHHEGADEALLDELEAFLADQPDPAPTGPVLLSGDITDDHLLVEERAGRWTIVGLFDFADAMLGEPGYELGAPAVFLTAGDAELAARLVRGCGLTPSPELGDELLSRVLLHRYGRLPEILPRLPGQPKTLPELRQALFPF
jgi:hygromycin-B 7''-O-kinase